MSKARSQASTTGGRQVQQTMPFCDICKENYTGTKANHEASENHTYEVSEWEKMVWYCPAYFCKRYGGKDWRPFDWQFLQQHRRPLGPGTTLWELKQHWSKEELADTATTYGIKANQKEAVLKQLLWRALNENAEDLEALRGRPADKPCTPTPSEMREGEGDDDDDNDAPPPTEMREGEGDDDDDNDAPPPKKRASAPSATHEARSVTQPKKRGRPLGSKNKPKVVSGATRAPAPVRAVNEGQSSATVATNPQIFLQLDGAQSQKMIRVPRTITYFDLQGHITQKLNREATLSFVDSDGVRIDVDDNDSLELFFSMSGKRLTLKCTVPAAVSPIVSIAAPQSIVGLGVAKRSRSKTRSEEDSLNARGEP